MVGQILKCLVDFRALLNYSNTAKNLKSQPIMHKSPKSKTFVSALFFKCTAILSN